LSVSFKKPLLSRKSEVDDVEETLRRMEEALNMGPLSAFVATPTKVQGNTVQAKCRIITLSDSAYMLVILDHNFELKNELVNGQSFLKRDGTETTLPVHFCWLFYTVSETITCHLCIDMTYEALPTKLSPMIRMCTRNWMHPLRI